MNANHTELPEDMGRILGITLALWGGAVLAAGAGGVFVKLAAEELAALAIFATSVAMLAYFVDPAVRAFAGVPRQLGIVAIVLDVVVAADVVSMLGSPSWAALASLPHAATLFFVLPLAAVATVAALDRRAAPLRSARAKSPGAKPAAT